ncbi:hypothetical protein GCM10025865_13650 [Paraoerskovia sediminicola]|uniref:AAA+ ATPase domain-containing protein n=1 Tax=Paraoerskovia sediminicola TaxID=1138587 RepID=A0ABM8G1Z3_9CELL|nr:hypothetical protein GCM10025865_13650 [Paraoerskovia sediminicola]
MPSVDDSMDEVWAQTISTLESNPDLSNRQLAYIRLAKPMALLDDTMFLAVSHEHTRSYLETSVREDLMGAMASVLGRDVRFAITVDPQITSDPPSGPSRDVDDDRAPGPDELRTDGPPSEDPAPADREPPRRPAEPSRLNPKYVFETFVIGASNRFAHAAAVAVAEAPAKAYNPLFIYGDSGLGKTHLLHAIGHYAHNLYPHVRVRYVNSEEFTNDFINSIGEGKAGSFQRRYRDVDVLLIDDIQFLQGKEQTMEEFFHTFNALHNANKQVVITSDLPPSSSPASRTGSGPGSSGA